jgi:hypothetical protein
MKKPVPVAGVDKADMIILLPVSTAGALRDPDRPMAALRISSRFAASGAKVRIFLPLAMTASSRALIISQA